MKERSPMKKKQKNRRKKRDVDVVDDELDFLDTVIAKNKKELDQHEKSNEE